MNTSKMSYETIETYIHSFPKEVQEILQTLRKTIQEEAPGAVEAMSYQMPTFKLNGKNLVHFAAWKNHIGFYPTPSGTESFQEALSVYTVSKGAIQFPLVQPMPLPLIRRMVAFRVKENLKNA